MNIPLIPGRGVTLLPSGDIFFGNNIQFKEKIAVATTENFGFTILNQFSDFPPASGGVTTLIENDIYRVNRTITVPDGIQIDLNGAPLIGLNNSRDRIIGSVDNDALIISNDKNVDIVNLTITNNGASGKCIDLIGTSGNSCFIRMVQFLQSFDVGDISSFGFVGGNDIALVSMSDGLTIDNTLIAVFIENYLAFGVNGGTYLKFTSSSTPIVSILDSVFSPSFGATALEIDNTTTPFGLILFSGTLFRGGGTLKAGFSEDDSNVSYDHLAAISFQERFDLTTDFTINTSTDINVILDEDDMASDSAMALVTQQSLKMFSSHDRQDVTSSTPQVTTVIGGFEDITGAVLTAKDLGQTGNYSFDFTALVQASVANTIATFRLLKNGVPEGTPRNVTIKTSNQDITVVFLGGFTGVVDGDVLKAQFGTDKGVLTISGFDIRIDGIPESRIVA